MSNRYVRDRILSPIGLPIAALVGVGFFIVNLSRVLLAVNKHASVAVAIGVAIVILSGSAWAASRRRIGRATLVALLALLAVTLGTGGAIAAKHGERAMEKRPAPAGQAAPAPRASQSSAPAAGPVVTLTAQNFAWHPTTITFASGGQVTVRVTNDDPTIHNWALYKDAARTQPVFQGDAFSGPGATKDYSFTAPPPGTYYFRCDVHPVMQGIAKVT